MVSPEAPAGGSASAFMERVMLMATDSPAATVARAIRRKVSVDLLMAIALLRVRARAEVATEVRVDAAVRRLGVGDRITGVVDVRCLGGAGLVRPEAAGVQAVPVEIDPWSHHQCDFVTAVGADAGGGEARDAVGRRRGEDIGAGQAGINGAGGASGLGERVGAVVVAVVVTVVVVLD